MNVISSVGLADRVGASRAALAPSPASTPRVVSSTAPAALTRATWGQGVEDAVVYGPPRVMATVPKVWASPAAQDDAIGTLMARNRDLRLQDTRLRAYGPNEQWRGLGGALLKHFGETGQDYSQTMADDPTWLEAMLNHDTIAALSPQEQAQRVADIRSAQQAALDDVSTFSAKANMTIKLTSGASVEVRIDVGIGFGGTTGTKVALTASGAMSDGERAAVARLGAGLDRALEGLGSGDAVGLDLSGLVGLDRSVIASLDLVASNPLGGQPLDSFSLHLGQGRSSVELKGSDGEMRLNLDVGPSGVNASAPQRQAAIQRMLERMDSAAQRGHANATLLQQMKSAFAHLQEAAAGGGGSAASTPGAGLLASGLADFDASFSGRGLRSNADGSTNEAGFTTYQLSQKTTLTDDARRGPPSTVQTLSEQLSADFRKAPPGRMLMVSNGTYAHTKIEDSSTIKTLISSAAVEPAMVLRRTTVQQNKTVTNLENHRVTSQQSVPLQRSVLERLQ